MWDICKFAFAGYSGLIGITIGLYQYSIDKSINLVTAIIAALGVGTIVGLFIFGLVIRDRIYFVIITRYLNEHRKFFLDKKPFGFENITQMYDDPSRPPYYHWASSHSWQAYLIAFLNSILVGLIAFIISDSFAILYWLSASFTFLCHLILALSVFLLSFIIQIAIAIIFLRSREGKSAYEATFGRG
jgi:hypothetical protein